MTRGSAGCTIEILYGDPFENQALPSMSSILLSSVAWIDAGLERQHAAFNQPTKHLVDDRVRG
jgi:hypothetical protein